MSLNFALETGRKMSLWHILYLSCNVKKH